MSAPVKFNQASSDYLIQPSLKLPGHLPGKVSSKTIVIGPEPGIIFDWWPVFRWLEKLIRFCFKKN